MLTDYNSSITFNARLGKNLKSYLCVSEFDGSMDRTAKFERLFSDTFEKNIDKNTVLEMNKHGGFYLYNLGLKGVKTSVSISKNKNKTLAQHILSECQSTFARAEYVLFEKYIAAQVAIGKALDKISSVGETRLDKKRLPYFRDLIGTAERILKENPDSKLSEGDFSDMINIQMLETVNTPEFQAQLAKMGFK